MPSMVSGKPITLILFRRLRDSRSSTLAANLALLVVSVLVFSSNTARRLS